MALVPDEHLRSWICYTTWLSWMSQRQDLTLHKIHTACDCTCTRIGVEIMLTTKACEASRTRHHLLYFSNVHSLEFTPLGLRQLGRSHHSWNRSKGSMDGFLFYWNMTKACIRTDVWSCAIGLGNNDCLDSRSTNAPALQCPPLEVNLCTLLCSGMSSVLPIYKQAQAQGTRATTPQRNSFFLLTFTHLPRQSFLSSTHLLLLFISSYTPPLPSTHPWRVYFRGILTLS